MSSIEKIDPNLAAASGSQCGQLQFYDVCRPPFRVYGLLPGDGPFCRIPEAVARQVNPGVLGLSRNTAGGRVRFRTDSARVAIRARMPGKCLMSHMSFVGSSGFDLYSIEDGVYHYKGSFIPPTDREDWFEAVIDLEVRKPRQLLIHFPLYDDVEQLCVGLDRDAAVEAGGHYSKDAPVIFYGSSITQGGCATRPGNSYANMISRMLDLDHRNLGFSGSAFGERAMAEYIARQQMCLFFLDYDHNSVPAQLKENHERFYLTIREQNPELPIVIASRTMIPRIPSMEAERDLRRRVILETYENALKRGDRKVSFVDGRTVYAQAELLGIPADSCTVDGIHPSDLGFACMANTFAAAISAMLK